VQRSLRAIHAAGVCHCDIRLPNVLNFEGSFQLIDFDLAINVGSKVALVEGAQFNERGQRLKASSVGETVDWTIVDDYEMAMNLFV
jgi:tRNA A-37 threonylcarbamoyl transferase component Bud32